MVLSNKKLKQKLRAAIAESSSTSAAAATEPDLNHSNSLSTNPDPNSNLQPQSLKQLLDSVTQKPRLSKREKKRRTTLDSLQGSETVNSNKGGGNSKDNEKVEEESKGDGGDKNKKKKRKRNDEESKNLEVGSDHDDGEESSNLGVENKKRKKKKEKRKRGEEEEEGGSAEEVGVVKEAKKLKKNKKKKKQQKKKKAKNEEDNKAGEELVGNEKPNKESDSQFSSYAATKVYVGGIPYIASENDIKRYFEGCGTITEIDYMTFPDSGKFRGIAIISFRTEGAAKRALALDGSEMDGLFLKIQPYKATSARKTSDFAPKIVDGYNKIYVGNLSWDITEEDLRKLLADCKISSIRLGTDKETGEFRGYAHVDFSDSLSLSMALKLDQEIVCGRPVKISCAVPKKGVNTKSRSVPLSNVVTSNGTVNAGLGAATSNAADDAGLATVSGKIRRRTCYECGEKGHLSSACPKKAADTSNSNTG